MIHLAYNLFVYSSSASRSPNIIPPFAIVIADSCSTSHFCMCSANLIPSTNPIGIVCKEPYGLWHMHSTQHTVNLDLPDLLPLISCHVHIVPTLTDILLLSNMGQLCNAGCLVTFFDTVSFTVRHCNCLLLLTGKRTPTTCL